MASELSSGRQFRRPDASKQEGASRHQTWRQALSLPSRHSCRLKRPSNQLPSQKSTASSRFWRFLMEAASKVQSSGARGASINIRAQNASDGPSESSNKAAIKNSESREPLEPRPSGSGSFGCPLDPRPSGSADYPGPLHPLVYPNSVRRQEPKAAGQKQEPPRPKKR